LKSFWVTWKMTAISTERMPKTSSSRRRWAAPAEGAVRLKTRKMASIAQLSSTPESRAQIGEGAWLWASGSQVCIGASPALVPKPTNTSRKAAEVAAAGSRAATGPRTGYEKS